MVCAPVGKPAGAIEGTEEVTDGMRFTADITLPGTLWVEVLRSPFLHARIRSIDVTKAAALSGVAMAAKGGGFPEVLVGVRMRDMPILAIDKVRFTGGSVAAVAAERVDIAEIALALIAVDYEDMPPCEIVAERQNMRSNNSSSYRASLLSNGSELACPHP